MQGIHPETLNRQSSGGTVAAGFSAISDINLEFLRVLTNPSVRGVSHLLGLDAPVLEGLCAMSPQQLQEVAATPQLLMEFHRAPDAVSQVTEVAEQHPPFLPSDAVWQHEMHGFVDRLMTCHPLLDMISIWSEKSCSGMRYHVSQPSAGIVPTL